MKKECRISCTFLVLIAIALAVATVGISGFNKLTSFASLDVENASGQFSVFFFIGIVFLLTLIVYVLKLKQTRGFLKSFFLG